MDDGSGSIPRWRMAAQRIGRKEAQRIGEWRCDGLSERRCKRFGERARDGGVGEQWHSGCGASRRQGLWDGRQRGGTLAIGKEGFVQCRRLWERAAAHGTGYGTLITRGTREKR